MECPICFGTFSCEAIQRHVERHFDDASGAPSAVNGLAALPGERGAGPAGRHGIDDDDDDVLLCCDECGADVPLSELEGHLEAHRLTMAADPAASESWAHIAMGEGSCTAAAERDRPAGTSRQQLGSLLPAGEGVMQLLKRYFEVVRGGAHGQVLLSGDLRHSHTSSYDMGWGCGWRNLQLLSSHLILRSADFKSALFRGDGSVPDIPELQDWLERAWAAGFDREGCQQLGGKIKGMKTWVGATDCTALLRFFRVRAQVADFQVPRRGTAGCHLGVECDGCGCHPIMGTRYRSLSAQNFDLCSSCHSGPMKSRGPFEALLPPGPQQPPRPTGSSWQQISDPPGRAAAEHLSLLRWVWRYFSNEAVALLAGDEQSPPVTAPSQGPSSDGVRKRAAVDAFAVLRASASGRVKLTGKPPLFFQHQGHSRTIVGIERLNNGERAKDYNLLVLCPSVPTARLTSWLTRQATPKGKKDGMDQVIVNGDRVSHDKYQIMFVDTAGGLVADDGELQQLKSIRAFRRSRYA
mmetsp:Transcript_31877/g.90540  ORF Transcript_31877/g.90540 Transcript_31877/m.90540 type:complete len:522 (+) Transcript_31877:128-1693(+)